MEAQQTVLDWLNERKVKYVLYEHEPAFTIEACQRMPFITDDVTICKNVFLCNRQKTRFYLLLLRPQTPFRTAVVSKALGVSRLSFAPEESLHELLHLSPGSVSPFGLLFDDSCSVKLCYEAAVRESTKIAFHPCDNRATLVFEQDVFWNDVAPALGHTAQCIPCVV